MKKNYVLFITIAIVCAFAFSCSEKNKMVDESESEYIQQSIFNKAPYIENYNAINKASKEFKDFTELYKEELPLEHIDYFNLQKVVFRDYPFLEALVIPITTDVQDQKSTLFTVFNKVTGERLTLFRYIDGFQDNQSGSISFASIYGEVLIRTEYKNGVRIKEFNQLINSNTKGWNCTDEEFGEFYFAAKEACESDWMCDVACAFNPCTIAYLASAVIECMSNEE